MTTHKQLHSKSHNVDHNDTSSHPMHNMLATSQLADANCALQETIQNELQSVNEAMHQNRTKANDLVRQLLHLKSASFDARRNGKTDVMPSNNNNMGGTKTNTNVTTYTTTTPQRRWTKRFFVDHKGTEPKPNIDTVRRRKIEKEKQSFFYHMQPPWTSKESDELLSIVKQYIANENETNHHQDDPFMTQDTNGDHDGDDAVGGAEKAKKSKIDFQVIANILNQNNALYSIGKRNTGRTITLHRRTAKECQIRYRSEINRNVKKQLFSDVLERNILEQVVATMLSNNGGACNMDWEKVAEDVTTALNNSSSLLSSNNYHYTAHDCLLAYHTKLKTPSPLLQTTTSTWTRDEDELLLKFIAAVGPQAVIDGKNILIQSTLFTQLLPHKSKSQIFTRINHSLLNPNMQRNDWNDYEERRLPICMKIYYTTNPQDSFQLYCASTHCYGRSTKSVVDKWNRSINPAYSTKPFTTEEDEELLNVMRSVLSDHNNKSTDDTLQHIGWVELSQTYFPHRHPQRLQNRWSELATDQDIINREKAKLAAVENNVSGNMSVTVKNRRRQQRQKRKTSG